MSSFAQAPLTAKKNLSSSVDLQDPKSAVPTFFGFILSHIPPALIDQTPCLGAAPSSGRTSPRCF